MDNLTYKKHNKRIVLNTSVLYIRLILSVLIGLYASRLLLQALGADDYGLYNVVGGLVVMMNLLGTSMIATSYRYIAVELGKGETANPNKVYNTLFVIHVVMALIFNLMENQKFLNYLPKSHCCWNLCYRCQNQSRNQNSKMMNYCFPWLSN